MGMTSMAIECSKNTLEPSPFISLFQAFVQHWALNNGTVCGESYDVNSLVSHFGIPMEVVRDYMKQRVLSSKIWDKSQAEAMMQGLLSEQILWAIEDRNEVVNQANLLKASQGGKYTPFVSAELNKALKLRLDSTASLQKLIQGMSGGGTVNIFTQINNQESEVRDAEYVTLEEAQEMVISASINQEKGEEIKLLETKYDLESLPVVVATEQDGVDTSKEALTVRGTELSSITDNYKGADKAFQEDHHNMRREIENNIIPDDDPEVAIYEDIREDVSPFSAANFLNN